MCKMSVIHICKFSKTAVKWPWSIHHSFLKILLEKTIHFIWLDTRFGTMHTLRSWLLTLVLKPTMQQETENYNASIELKNEIHEKIFRIISKNEVSQSMFCYVDYVYWCKLFYIWLRCSTTVTLLSIPLRMYH